MHTMNEIELSRQRREEVAQQVENNHLVRRLRAARHRVAAGTGNALLGRVFTWSQRKGQTAGC